MLTHDVRIQVPRNGFIECLSLHFYQHISKFYTMIWLQTLEILDMNGVATWGDVYCSDETN